MKTFIKLMQVLVQIEIRFLKQLFKTRSLKIYLKKFYIDYYYFY